MANGDMQARLLLNTSDFEKGKKRAIDGSKEMKQEAEKNSESMVTAFGKVASTIAAMKGVQELFTAAVNSSQAATDMFGRSMEVASTVTNNFIYALTNADFSAFNNGLADLARKARDAYDAYDQLANSMMSGGYVSATVGANYRAAMVRARDKSLTFEQREAAVADARKYSAELAEAAGVIKDKSIDALVAGIAANTGLDASLISTATIDKTFRVDATAGYKAQREQIEKSYKEYLSKLPTNANDAILKAFDEKPLLGLSLGAQGTSIKFGAALGKTLGLPEEDRKKAAALALQYKDTIVAYQLLFKATDENLGGLIQTAGNSVAYENQISEQTNSINEVARSIGEERAAKLKTDAENAKKARKEAEDARKSEEELFRELEHLREGIRRYNASEDAMRGISYDNSGLSQLALVGKGAGKIYEDRRVAFDPKRDGALLPAVDIPSYDSILLSLSEKKAEGLNKYAEGVNLLTSAFTGLGNAIGGTAGAWAEWVGTIGNAVSQIISLIGYIWAEKAAHDANATAAAEDAAAKALSSYAGIPFAGIALGVGAVTSIVAALMSIPKLAKGGIATSATLGIFGEAGPEAIIPLNKLDQYVNAGSKDVRVHGEVRVAGKELSVVLNNYNKSRAVYGN